MVEITETFFARDRGEWRDWLSKHHRDSAEIWLIILKKHVKEPCVSYEEAVEEAVCFGWIDGTLKRIDDRQHVIRFTPRRKGSIWSESNLERVRRMIEQGRMTEAGLRIFEARDPDLVPPSVNYRGKDVSVPDYFEQELKESPPAWEVFQSFPPSHKNQYIGWIETAKREETRLRRAKKAAEMIIAEKKGGG